jgi:Domain of unknown function (DUF4870)
MTVAGKPHYPRHAGLPEPLPTEREELLGTVGYVGAIFLGPVVPLAVYLTGRASPFARRHATQALNAALTFLLYAVSGTIVGGLLSFDNLSAALLVVVPLAVVYWLIMAGHLVAAALDASRGGFRQLPAWMCAVLVR